MLEILEKNLGKIQPSELKAQCKILERQELHHLKNKI